MPSPSGKDRMGQKPEMLSLNLPKCPINVIPAGFIAAAFHPLRRRGVRRTGWFLLLGVF